MDRRGKCAKLTSKGQAFVSDVTRHFRRVKVEAAA
jgi:hypothetical protein